jgi:anti-sigma28 factor (negative regulator of flagellin synthesis)
MIDSIGARKPDFSLLRMEKGLEPEIALPARRDAESSRPVTSLSQAAVTSRMAGPMPFDSARVEALAQAIQGGTYRLDANRTAAALLVAVTGKPA